MASFLFPLRTLSEQSVVLEAKLKQRVSVSVLAFVKRLLKASVLFLSGSFYFAFHNSGIFEVQRSYFNVSKHFLKGQLVLFMFFFC